MKAYKVLSNEVDTVDQLIIAQKVVSEFLDTANSSEKRAYTIHFLEWLSDQLEGEPTPTKKGKARI